MAIVCHFSGRTHTAIAVRVESQAFFAAVTQHTQEARLIPLQEKGLLSVTERCSEQSGHVEMSTLWHAGLKGEPPPSPTSSLDFGLELLILQWQLCVTFLVEHIQLLQSELNPKPFLLP